MMQLGNYAFALAPQTEIGIVNEPLNGDPIFDVLKCDIEKRFDEMFEFVEEIQTVHMRFDNHRVYRHKTSGVQIIKKHVYFGDENRYHQLSEINNTSLCPVIHSSHTQSCFFELDLRTYGYITLAEHFKNIAANEKLVRLTERAVLSHVYYLAVSGITHRDLQWNNILINPVNGRIKFIDMKLVLTDMDWNIGEYFMESLRVH